jgi:malate dehydrogenase (oxaloacetate-decarboxylating)(NADP+)
MPKLLKKNEALDYHSQGKPGKIEVQPTKETKTQRDLALAYSPGVAEPCLEIAKNVEDVYKYTAKGNLVAVISNGTAVLGLGNIGPEASKPVMEGKGLLFKIYADIDVFDIELNSTNVEEFITVVKSLEPTFGGINLEDIKAPECFEIEERLKKALKIPIMHDDQHGTAIISGAALLNACELQKKQLSKIKIVVSGAGASAIACCKIYIALGVDVKNIVMFDSLGAITTSRKDLDFRKQQFATNRKIDSLVGALNGADVFIGLSKGNILSGKDLKGMAKNPIVFALANPTPEIPYHEAIAARPDIIMATGRSDYPNQVNNVLGFPYIFRGALDVRATQINEAMKLAAVKALADLAKKPVPDIVNVTYGEKNLSFGPMYIIPKPMDPRLLVTVSPAVAKAAIKSKVAKYPITNWEAYEENLAKRLGQDDNLLRSITSKAKQKPQRVVFAEGENLKIIKAAQLVLDDGIASPILLGNVKTIKAISKENQIDLTGIVLIDPKDASESKTRELYGDIFYQKRQRRGYNLFESKKIMRDRNYYGCMMVENGEADALISGLSKNYPDTLRPAIEIIGLEKAANKIAGMYMMLTKKGPIFFADTTVNENPTAYEIAEIAHLTAKEVKQLGITPRIALLSYSNFGSSSLPDALKMREAVKILHKQHPELCVDGEVQGNIAFDKELLKENYGFSNLMKGSPNVCIFPNLSSGNIAYNLLMSLGGAEAVGPILLGMKKSVHVLQLGSSVRQIVNMVAIAVIDANTKNKKIKNNIA